VSASFLFNINSSIEAKGAAFHVGPPGEGGGKALLGGGKLRPGGVGLKEKTT